MRSWRSPHRAAQEPANCGDSGPSGPATRSAGTNYGCPRSWCWAHSAGQTACLFGTITVSAGAAPADRRRKCFLIYPPTLHMERVLTELITAGACNLWRLRAIWPCVLVALLDRQTFWTWVRVRLPKWPVDGVDADASSPTPQARIQHLQALKPGRLFFVIPAQTISVYRDN